MLKFPEPELQAVVSELLGLNMALLQEHKTPLTTKTSLLPLA